MNMNKYAQIAINAVNNVKEKWEDIEKDYMLTDVVEIHFLELPKFRKVLDKNYKENAIERWLAFLEKDIPETTLRELMSMEPAIKKAENKLEYLSSDKVTMDIYWERERSLHERANMISTAEERKNIENAINFLKLGVSIDIVVQGTGLPKEKVVELYNTLRGAQ